MTDPATCQMLNQTIVAARKNSISEIMPEMNDRIRGNLLEAINKTVDEGIKQIKTEVEKVVSEKVESAERRCNLKTMSEAELLESYKRRDNTRDVGTKEDRSSGNKAIRSQRKMPFNWRRKRARMLLQKTFHLHVVCQAATKARSTQLFSNCLDV